MSRTNLAWMVLLPTLLIVGSVMKFVSAAASGSRDFDRLRMIADVLSLVDEHYVDEMTEEKKQKLVTDMLNGGLMLLDRNNMYLTEDALEDFDHQSSGEFGGVGIIMQLDDPSPFLVIETPIANTPAYDAGIQTGDIIEAVDGVSTENMTIEQAKRRISGPPGSSVTLRVRRHGATRTEDITLQRAIIEVPVVQGATRDPADPRQWDYMIDPVNKIAVIRLQQFTGKTSKELKPALEACERAGARALILDLRDNPGGLLHEAVDVSDLFLASGVVCSTKGRAERRILTAKDDHSTWENATTRPMAVLLNRNSASASEIVAAALQDNSRAVVVGERSYGKGSVQKVLNLPGNRGAIKLTSEKWYTPKDRGIHRDPGMTAKDRWGVDPNPGLEVALSDEEWRNYTIHMRRLNILPGKPGVAPPTPLQFPPELTLPDDYQDRVMTRAIEYLRTQLAAPAAAP